jgi:hypothetical protein
MLRLSTCHGLSTNGVFCCCLCALHMCQHIRILGAYATGDTLASPDVKRHAMQSLSQSDSNSFWASLDEGDAGTGARNGGLVMTGPTGTNVMDVVVILVGNDAV